tara:strand:+ start:37 stop:783 length:747 start_codon:yes stop_codon:yes gene_type:complete
MTINTLNKEPQPSIWEELKWHPSKEQLEQFKKLQYLLSELNEKLNLTRLIEGDDYWVTQVFDSIWPLTKELNQPNIKYNLVDVGSGCGFPGLAIAIALPQAQVTLIEATNKKKAALEFITNELGLTTRVKVRHERVEITGRNPSFRNVFDIAMARAVGKDSVVAEYLVPLIKNNGEAILFKGKWEQIDEINLKNALLILNARIKSISSIQLPSNRGTRHQIRITPTDKCPKAYPRAIGIPKKRPLGIN